MTADAPRQLVLDLPLAAADGVEDFMVSASNAAAHRLIDAWPNWAVSAACISGPPGAGKSHLAAIWAARSGAATVAAAALDDAHLAQFGDVGALVVEDVDAIGTGDGARQCEQHLFHLLNLAREREGFVLLTSTREPGDITFVVPDLRSRVRALANAAIDAPDDALLGAILVKLFDDRQLSVDPAVIASLLRRMERSAETAVRLVDAIDREALAKRRRVTRVLALDVLHGLDAGASGGTGASSHVA